MPIDLVANETTARNVGRAGLVMALLQSVCTAVLTLSGIRVAIGLTALAAAGGVYEPERGWHGDAIRIPMLVLATLGALINLAVLAWIRHLRARPSAQWRKRGLTQKEKRSAFRLPSPSSHSSLSRLSSGP